ncbi:hypothetical protein tb265_26500 [Gemmatimonadetes bacterium T265]|nr:hypothetical protein tb265_26500 [Gemmatimonadetes bacterium T265]
MLGLSRDVPTLDATAWAVLVGGVALIALVVWYFFGEREPARVPTTRDVPSAERDPRAAP